MLLDVLNQPILVLARAEKVAFLAHALHRAAAIGAELALLQLRLRPVRLARRAVPALVLAFIDIPLLIELAEDFLYHRFMAFVRGADKIAVFHVHHLPQVLDARHDSIHELLRRHALFLRAALNFLPVLVRARQKEHVVAGQAFEARHGIRRHRAVAVPDMQFVRRIVNRRGDVERALVRHETPPLYSGKKPVPNKGRAYAVSYHPGCFAPRHHAAGHNGARRPPLARRLEKAAPEPCSRAAYRPAFTCPGSLSQPFSALLFPSLRLWPHYTARAGQSQAIPSQSPPPPLRFS